MGYWLTQKDETSWEMLSAAKTDLKSLKPSVDFIPSSWIASASLKEELGSTSLCVSHYLVDSPKVW